MFPGVISRGHRASSVALSIFVMISTVAWANAANTSEPSERPTWVGAAELESANGAQLLEWTGPEDSTSYEYELQESSTPSFAAAETRYRGTLASFYVSGRLEGRSHFRVRARPIEGTAVGPWSAWSTSRVLVVEHHQPGLALALFGLGAAVFLITAVTVWIGARGTRGVA